MKHLSLIRFSIIIIILFSPLLMFNGSDESFSYENRTIAKYPERFESVDSYKKEIELYLNDRFGFRSQLIGLNTYIKYNIYNDIGNSKAIIGKNGWIYYISISDGNNLDDFLLENNKQNSLSSISTEIIKRADWCRDNSIPFLFIIAPNKHNVYPENFPFDKPSGTNLAESLVQDLELRGINVMYPKDFLIEKKETLLYYEQDTHWNQNASFLFFNELLYPYIKERFPNTIFNRFDYEVEKNISSSTGDLVPMLGMSNYMRNTEYTYSPENTDWNDIFHSIPGDPLITVNIENKLPKAVIFRDSFFESLQPFTSTIFSEADYLWKYFVNEDTDYILEQKPDIVIWEVVERHLTMIPEFSKK